MDPAERKRLEAKDAVERGKRACSPKSQIPNISHQVKSYRMLLKTLNKKSRCQAVVVKDLRLI